MTDKQEWKPWEWYPHIWKTEASFWTYLRGCFRRGIWERSPVKLDFKNKVVGDPPEGYTGRAKSGQYCALSGEWTGKSAGEIDHKIGNVSLRSEKDVLEFVKHLIPHPDNMQFVNKESHKIKSYAEKQGISFEEARATKKAIAIEKGDAKGYLRRAGIEPASNSKGRRKQLVELLTGGECKQ